MPRFYSPEWIAAFNEAVGDLAAEGEAGNAGDGEPAGAVRGPTRFRVAQVVSGSPDGELEVVLEVTDGRLHVERRDLTPGEPAAPEADVTVLLRYEDAIALSRGELDAARMVATGRLKVRGNLSLLVAGQALLTAAAERLAPLAASTTY